MGGVAEKKERQWDVHCLGKKVRKILHRKKQQPKIPPQKVKQEHAEFRERDKSHLSNVTSV